MLGYLLLIGDTKEIGRQLQDAKQAPMTFRMRDKHTLVDESHVCATVAAGGSPIEALSYQSDQKAAKKL